MDKFDLMFKYQKNLQSLMNNNYNQEYINTMILALISEANETLNETPWKPWKKKQIFNKDNYINELADILHFFINLCIAKNISSEDIFIKFLEKNKENIERINNGY
jgi:dimeric dUTPase (all-alpha-NTP-PPase superfamily)